MRIRLTVLLLLFALTTASWGQTATTISGSPLTIYLNPLTNFQVVNSNVGPGGNIFPPSENDFPSSGIFLRVNGQLFGFLGTQWTAVSQTPVIGTGTAADPFTTTTTVAAGTTGVFLAVTTRYVNGEGFFRQSYSITNTSGAPANLDLYLSADLYLGGSDQGVGVFQPSSGAVGGANCADQPTVGTPEGTNNILFIPITPADHYVEASFGTNYNFVIGPGPLPDTINPNCVDNGASLQWIRTLPPGGATTVDAAVSFGQVPTIASFRVDSATPAQSGPGTTLNVVLSGVGFQAGTTFSFGNGITVNSTTIDSTTQATVNVTIAAGTPAGPRDIVAVQSPGGATNTLVGGFEVAGPAVIPKLFISDSAVVEGSSGVSQMFFTIQLSEASSSPVTVSFATSDVTAVAGVDYLAQSGSTTLGPGETSRQISIAILGDTVQEPDETFLVTLTDPVNATVERGVASGLILDDDRPRAELSVTARYDQESLVRPLDPLVWIGEIRNDGPDTATNVTITVRRPLNSAAMPGSNTAYKVLSPANCTAQRADEQLPGPNQTTITITYDTITCQVESLGPNQTTSVQILSIADPARLIAFNGGDLGAVPHTITVTASENDQNPTNNSDRWPDLVTTSQDPVQQLLIRDHRDPVAPGEQVVYTVARAGQALPENVPIGDVQLFATANLDVVALPDGCSTETDLAGRTVITCAAILPFTDFVFRHDNPGALSDIASLSGGLLQFDEAGTPFTVGQSVELTSIGGTTEGSDVSLTLGGPTTLERGVTATYTLVAGNLGPSAVDNVTIDAVSSDAPIALVPGQFCATLPCNLGSLNAGGSRALMFTLTVPSDRQTGFIRISAAATSSAPDRNSSNNVVNAAIPLVCGSLDAPQISVVGSVTSLQPYVVSWTVSPGATEYILEEATTREFTTITESRRVTGTSEEFVKAVFSPREFFYRVRALNDCGTAAEGVSSIIQTLIEPTPTNLVEPTASTPLGSTQPVVSTITVFSPEQREVPYVAESDQPWLRITPATGLLLPTGTQLTVSVDPTGLPVGAQTATIMIRRTDLPLLTTGPDQASPSSSVTAVPFSISLVTPVTTASKTTASNNTLIIPVVAHAQGASGEFRSDVRIFNSALRRVAHRVLFTPSATDARSSSLVTTLNIDPGQTVAMDDILRKWFGLGGPSSVNASGVIEIRPMDAPSANSTIATSRTYRIGAEGGGTRGEYIAAVPLSQFISRTGGTLSLQQLAQNAQFRTNVGLVEGSGAPVSVLVRGLDAAGRVLFTLPVMLKAGEQTQLNSIFAQNGITANDARIEVLATGGAGRVTAYASVLDSMTSDALHVAGLNVDQAAANELVVAGVAELQGQTSRWRTDMRIYNASDRPSQATLQFYPQGSVEVGSEATVTIAPGQVLALDNVVGTTLGRQNTLGAIHVITNEALIVTARTFNQLAANGATQGQFVPAITPAEGVRLNERALHMLNVEQSVNYRTNLGLAEMSGAPVRVEITAVPPDSRVVVRTEVVLGPNEFRQISNILAQMGLPTVYNARISVRVIDGPGRLTAYASAIDNRTDDAIFVAAR